MSTILMAIAFAVVSFVGLLGVFVNKIAPLELEACVALRREVPSSCPIANGAAMAAILAAGMESLAMAVFVLANEAERNRPQRAEYFRGGRIV